MEQNITLTLPKELHTRLKLLALKQDTSMKEIVRQALEKELKLREKEIEKNER